MEKGVSLTPLSKHVISKQAHKTKKSSNDIRLQAVYLTHDMWNDSVGEGLKQGQNTAHESGTNSRPTASNKSEARSRILHGKVLILTNNVHN